MVSPKVDDGFLHAGQTATRGTLRIAETFASRQGEGKRTGTDSFFIRTSGCNLRCWFCDTPYASWNPEGPQRPIDELIDECRSSGAKDIVLTGGEPLLFEPIVELNDRLRKAGFYTTIETAGTVDRPVQCDLLSMSPKFASSRPDADRHPTWSARHDQRRMPIATMRRLIDRAVSTQVKFVVDTTDDYDELLKIVADLRVDAGDVWIMPQGSTNKAMDAAVEWLRPWSESQGFQYCDRMQIRWYGNRRGT